MTNFAIITAAVSLAVFAGFTALSVVKFGWQKSYSTYAHLWDKAVPINRFTNLWSIVTVIVGLLLFPSLIERGAGNPWQFIGFFIPLYLWVVGFTPNYLTDAKQKKFHVAGALGCAALAIVWVIFIRHLWWLPLLAVLLAWIAAYVSNTLGKSDVFWAEMAMFASAYAALFIG